MEVTDLRLFLFANGIGILSMGVEAFHLTAAEALWINETMRKVYPSSGRQVREGRFPSRIALAIERGGVKETLVEEKFERAEMTGFLPPLSETITELLYFADYRRQEFEPVLDERTIVYSYIAVDPAGLPEDYLRSEDYQVLLSRFLYVDRAGEGFRYEPEFTRAQMQRQLYRCWAHQGTYYGFTSYSNITAAIGTFDCDEHLLREGFLVHRMFNTRYYLMALVALFYRATLLDFSERTALVSKQLYLDQEDQRFAVENIQKPIAVLPVRKIAPPLALDGSRQFAWACPWDTVSVTKQPLNGGEQKVYKLWEHRVKVVHIVPYPTGQRALIWTGDGVCWVELPGSPALDLKAPPGEK